MTDQWIPSIPAMKQHNIHYQWLLYPVLGVLLNAGIWGAALAYLNVAKPSYISQWALILPGTESGFNVTLPNIGQATSSANSPFGSTSMDPRANYEYLATSEAVVDRAASTLKLAKKEFGKPRVKLVDNTTILQFEIAGLSAKQAHQKAFALHNAFIRQVEALRREERQRRDIGAETTLRSAQAKLKSAQDRLSQFKLRSGLNSTDQIGNLVASIEQLRKQRIEVLAQQQQSTQRLQQLSVDLSMTPRQATEAFILNADQLFQLQLKTYSEATATLEILMSKWGPNHPQVVKEQLRQVAAQRSLLDRGKTLLGRSVDQQLLSFYQFGTNAAGGAREGLFRDLVAVQADQVGLTAQAKMLDRQVAILEKRLSQLGQYGFKLEQLQRDLQIAEAVFASTVTKLDLSKSDQFSAYPLVQVLRQPTLDTEPVSPKKTLVYAGAGGGSLLATTGLLILGIRHHRRQRSRTLAKL
jgi:uncharacterized protein involved in exopolysaccharide biosynthesis